MNHARKKAKKNPKKQKTNQQTKIPTECNKKLGHI